MRNLVSDAHKLTQKYAALLEEGLVRAGLNAADRDVIHQNIQYDSGIYLSNKPTYQLHEASFRAFCNEHLHVDIAEKMYKIKYLYQHQVDGIQSILNNQDTVISAGTGSGKTETFLAPVIHHARLQKQPGVKAIIIYPMNALANDQIQRIGEYTEELSISFGIYTGATPRNSRDEVIQSSFSHQKLYRDEMIKNPPDILITNYVMLDWMLSRPREHNLFVQSVHTLRYIILDEVHVYRGSRAAHIKYLLNRLKHYTSSRPVHIATSATLIDKKGNQSTLNDFLRELFDAEDTPTIVRAVSSTAADDTPAIPVPDLRDVELNYDLQGNNVDANYEIPVLVEKLIGYRMSDQSWILSADKQKPVFEMVRKNAFYRAFMQAIADGALNIDQLIVLFQEITEHDYTGQQARTIVFAYLDLFAYMDRTDVEEINKLLDVRLHLFIRDMIGHLRIDLETGQYIATHRDFSPDTGHRIYPVDRQDIRVGIAKVSGQRISSFLHHETDDANNIFYVRIAIADQVDFDEFATRVDIDHEGHIIPSVEGKFRVAPLEGTHFDQISGRLIDPGEEIPDHYYLYAIVETLLSQQQKSCKLLAFIDNREQASRYSAIFRDEFASAFLFQYLCLTYTDFHRMLESDPVKALNDLRQTASELEMGRLEETIFADLDLWYWRMIATPSRKGGRNNILKLRSDVRERLSPLEIEIIEKIFLPERAIVKPGLNPDEHKGNHIRFQLWRAFDHSGIHLRGDSSGDPSFHSLAISDTQSAIYSDVVADRIDDIEASIYDLVKQGVLVTQITTDDKTHYYLDWQHISFNLPPPIYRTYDELKSHLLLTGAVHSSELQNSERQSVEERFKAKDGDLNVLVSTPTLEMGIDIGDLETVLLIGTPPQPANYAQRAGRAGRGADQEALIVTFCSTYSAHDMYMFNNPTRMIDGEVAPPSFEPKNQTVIEKHICAYLLRNLSSTGELRAFRRNLHHEIETERTELQTMFGAHFDGMNDFLQHVFPERVDNLIDIVSRNRSSLQIAAYNHGFFPDYFAQDDEIMLIERTSQEENLQNARWLTSDDALATRDIEQAFSAFIPGEAIYIAGDIYRIEPEGKQQTLPDGAMQFQYFLAEREVRFAIRSKTRRKYDRVKFTRELHDTEKVLGKGILQIHYEPDLLLSFRNRGLIDGNRVEKAPGFPFGYDIDRDSLVLQFDPHVCNEITQLSFLSALDRTITEAFGLEGDEIQILSRMKYWTEGIDIDDAPEVHILYDSLGNSNLPFTIIFKYVVEVIERTYERLKQCSCDTDGCYQCIRSYSTQYIDGHISRSAAMDFCAYILMEAMYRPGIQPFKLAGPEPDLVLTVEVSGEIINVQSNYGQPLKSQIVESQNATIFKAIADVIERDYHPGMKALQIKSRTLPYLIDTVNNRSVKKDKDAFNYLQFMLLNFEFIEGQPV